MTQLLYGIKQVRIGPAEDAIVKALVAYYASHPQLVPAMDRRHITDSTAIRQALRDKARELGIEVRIAEGSDAT